MKIYTFYTPSHKEIYDKYFLTSPAIEEYEVISEEFPQECLSGNYLSEGWMDTMHRKLDLIIKAIEDNMGEVFVHADCDVQFLKPSKEYIESIFHNTNVDIVLQDDIYTMCAGFFACRSSAKTLLLFNMVKDNIRSFEHDQLALNHFIKNWNSYNRIEKLNYRVFDKRIWNVGHSIYNRWDGQEFKVPENILVHHANWTVGTQNKLKLMGIVKGMVIS